MPHTYLVFSRSGQAVVAFVQTEGEAYAAATIGRLTMQGMLPDGEYEAYYVTDEPPTLGLAGDAWTEEAIYADLYAAASEARGWHCLYCGGPLGEGEHCHQPVCIEALAAARRRMGLEG